MPAICDSRASILAADKNGPDRRLPRIRFLAIARAIYWFDVDQTARKVRILAVFFGGQDHIRRMLVRLLDRNETR